MRRRLFGALAASAFLVGACGQSVPPESRPAASWQRLPDAPLSPRAQALGVWTGDEVLVVGGMTAPCPPMASCAPPRTPPLRDGAAYDPVARTWRPIANAPVGWSYAETAVVGDTMFLAAFGLGEQQRSGGDFLSYSMTTNSWRQLTWLDPAGVDGYHLTAAGDRVVAVSATDERGERPDWIYDPPTQRWAQLPDDPMTEAFDRRMVSVGNRLVLFDREGAAVGEQRPAVVRAALLDVDAGTWEHLPDSRSLETYPWLVDQGRLVNPLVVPGYGPVRPLPWGGILDLARREWSGLPAGPAEPRASAGAIGHDGALFQGYEGFALDLRTDAWLAVPTLTEDDRTFGRTVTNAGADLFVFGGASWGGGRSPVLLADAWLWRTGGVRN